MISCLKAGAIVLAGLALASCASTPPPPPITWTGGNPAHLAADKATCKKDSAETDMNDAGSYSDPRYGPTNAMAAAINRDAPLTDQRAAVRAAAFAACMTDKGWKAEQ
jgi:hypothetical protein